MAYISLPHDLAIHGAGGGSIIMLVMDGLGGLPHPDTGLTELESAATPHLDVLAARSSLGMLAPVGRMALTNYLGQTLIGISVFYGVGIGILTVLIRVVNPAYPEGMMLAILFMNMFAPLIDYYVVRANVKRRMARYAA